LKLLYEVSRRAGLQSVGAVAKYCIVGAVSFFASAMRLV
jgi:hypothetical protein